MGNMNEYERRRLENMNGNNDEMFKIHSNLTDLSSAKRHNHSQSSGKRGGMKMRKTEAPVVLRRSLRTRGVSPDAATASGLKDDLKQNSRTSSAFLVNKNYPHEKEAVQMGEAYTNEDGSGRKLIETITRCFKKSEIFKPRITTRVDDDVETALMQLKPENIARLLQGRIMNLSFYPTLDMQMVVAGNKDGHLGFWNLNADDDAKYVYHPHPGPISGIVVDPFSILKMYSSCCDGFIRLMDVEKEVFDMLYSSEYSIFSISLRPHGHNSLYYSNGMGGVGVFDVRAGKSLLSSYPLHEDKICTIDFNLENNNIMATSSTDRTACIWDLRNLSTDKPKPLKTVSHTRAVHSAYFSPTGKFLATTSVDNTVGIASGANYEDTSMVDHENHTTRWISKFKGIWGWDDSSIFIGNMKRGVDVISVAEKTIVATLKSDLITAIPCRLASHPHSVGTLAGATSGGQVYVWTIS